LVGLVWILLKLPDMPDAVPTRPQLLILFIAALVPRLAGALWLPNAFGDAYAYTEQIYYLRRGLLTGSFSVSNLFGFWLPLYQLICAGISAVVGSPFYIPKLVSAICGGGVCVLVYLLTWLVTSKKRLSLTCAMLVALNPYHILYSSSAMTDVPHAFFILLSAYCCIKNRWLLASICAIAAGLMRIESWILIPIIPLTQFLKESRISNQDRPRLGWQRLVSKRFLTSIMLGLFLAVGPLSWLYISWKATGSLEKYFEIRNNYIVETLATTPWLTSFSPARVGLDLLRLVYTTNPLVMYGAIVLLVVVLKQKSARAGRASLIARMLLPLTNLLATADGLVLTFFSSHLAFLLLAYFTNNQPEIWPRYGLIFFTLGLPLLASRWLTVSTRTARVSLTGTARVSPTGTTRVSPTVTARVSRAHEREARTSPGSLALIYVPALVFALQFCVQLVDVTRLTVKNDPHVIAAEFLEDQRNADGSIKVYCEDGAIRVLSGIPLEEFKDQYNSPADDEKFLESLKDNQVRFLVYKDLPGSRLKEMISRIRAGTGSNGITLEEIVPRSRRNVKDTVIVYRVHENELANAAAEHSKPNPYRRQ
jgi:Dolichyl-phosphate-mannose-protein mannosyltransferase